MAANCGSEWKLVVSFGANARQSSNVAAPSATSGSEQSHGIQICDTTSFRSARPGINPNHLPSTGVSTQCRQDFLRAHRLPLLQMFARDLILLTPGLLFLAAVLGYWMSRKALHPIAELALRARQISTGKSECADSQFPLQKMRSSDLSETLNQMLARIESGVRSIRGFHGQCCP